LSAQRHVKPASLQPEHLLALWRGEVEDSYPQLALLSTMALALRGLGHPREQAFELAQQYWDARNTSN
jgi:hypothetical protein